MTKKNIKIEKIVPPVLYILIILLPIIIAYFNKDNILILQGCTTAFLVFISAGVTYFFTKYFFEYEKYLRWNKIKDYVFNSLDIEFYYILGGIAELCNLSNEVTGLINVNINSSEYFESSKKFLKKLISEKIKIGSKYRKEVLEEKFDIFENFLKKIDPFLVKFIDYMDTDLIVNLINIEDALNHILIIKRLYKYKLGSPKEDLKEIEEQLERIINNMKTATAIKNL